MTVGNSSWRLPYVQEHKNPVQLRAAGDGRRDSRGGAAIREEAERLQQALESQRGRVSRGRRGGGGGFQEAAALPRDGRAAEEPGGRGGQSQGARCPEIPRAVDLSRSRFPVARRAQHEARCAYSGQACEKPPCLCPRFF